MQVVHTHSNSIIYVLDGEGEKQKRYQVQVKRLSKSRVLQCSCKGFKQLRDCRHCQEVRKEKPGFYAEPKKEKSAECIGDCRQQIKNDLLKLSF
jgi:hypothetical protein